jgi:zinc D-Ala-D-Ala dipeptidase
MDLVYKIKYLQRFSLALFISNLVAFNLAAQSKIVNKYGLTVIGNIKVLQNEINNDSSLQMINLQKYIPGIDLDLKYATRDNFMHEKLYPPVHTTFLRKPAADALKKVVEDLKDQNLSLKIFDAYRPYSVTEKMWEKVKDDRYAADPRKGSGHNRGAAVDLTLINLKTKKELLMGTGFDNFTDSAHADFKDLPDSILANRNLLKSVMEKYGFKQLSTEWWHFYLPNSSFELLDISFADLKKMDKKSSNK